VRNNPFEIIPVEDFNPVTGSDDPSYSYVNPGCEGSIRYDFSFTSPAGKVIIIKGELIKELYETLRQTMKEYMREAERDARVALVRFRD